MLPIWIMVLFIGGKPEVTIEASSEASCRAAQAKVVALTKYRGQNAISACYLKAG